MSTITSWRRLYATSAKKIPKINKNACGIQHLSDGLHAQIFPKKSLTGPSNNLTKLSLKYLQDNELLGKPCSENPPINFKLPTLNGDNINQHFYNIGMKSSYKYENLIDDLLKIGSTPLPIPKEWIYQSGWTRYSPNSPPESVPYPLEDELVYDCEVLYKTSPYAVMATCLSRKAWYSWCSPYLVGESDTNNHLIPFNTEARECLIVGHNVSFDRARVLEEYSLTPSKAFYLDTMSLHVAVSGMCSRQRGTWMKYKKGVKEKIKEQEKTLEDYRLMVQNSELRYTLSNAILDEESADDDDNLSMSLRDDPWMKTSSLNKLSDVAELHCGIKMEKQLRDHFASTDVNEIRDLFQTLMTYCAKDVIATYHVLYAVYPMYKKTVPHPVSFAALRHITTSFLPTNSKWEDYIHRCEEMYQESKSRVESQVHLICNSVVELKDKHLNTIPPWENDPWLSQLDWTIAPVKYKKDGTPFKRQKLPGYPEWYKKLVGKNELNLTIKSRVCLLLLKLLWENKPIFWTESKGWCFVVENSEIDEFVAKNYLQCNPQIILEMSLEDPETKKKFKGKAKKAKKESKKKVSSKSKATEVTEEEEIKFDDEIDTQKELEDDIKSLYVEKDELVRENLKKLIKSGKTLFKIPHEDGADARVTSLISKPFLRYYEEGILTSNEPIAEDAFQSNVRNSYWVSSRERIMNQFVVYQNTLNQQVTEKAKNISETKDEFKDASENTDQPELGFIIPQIIPMGTITRRAVEKTWLTASNAKKNRLGSELKSLVQAPPGYVFVGADVDSEELWIASLVGDSVFKLHGGTALGWMTLEGTKNAGTDLHSKTAKILGISRNEAKVFNYGRIYGAGVKFATSLLKKFNPSITDEEADKVAKTLYAETKGNTSVIKTPTNTGGDDKVKIWFGGSESVVFNRLENIAEQDDPKTPVLGAGITAALNRTNLNSKSFLPSRINWAIQSSGVDYLHLLLISMEYLSRIYGVDLRLAITVHDEVRYLAKEKDKYKCAMLLQIANLWTRAMFCYQLGIENIPQSCAFFSCVDIDFVLRKEVDFDCITPSNPHPIPHGESLDIYQLLEKPEIQEMLNSLNDESELKNISTDFKIPRPVEALDKAMDTQTKLKWINLQISKTKEEFSKQKRIFFSTVDHSKLEKFSKKLITDDNKVDEVVCDGLFESNNSTTELLDAGVVLEQIIDPMIEKQDAKSKSKAKYKLKSRSKPKTTKKDDVTENAEDYAIPPSDEYNLSMSPTSFFIEQTSEALLGAIQKKQSKSSKSATNSRSKSSSKPRSRSDGISVDDDFSTTSFAHSHSSEFTMHELEEIQKS